MLEFVILVGLLLLLQGLIITVILSFYTGTPFGESWSWTWSKAWVPVVFTIGNIIGAL